MVPTSPVGNQPSRRDRVAAPVPVADVRPAHLPLPGLARLALRSVRPHAPNLHERQRSADRIGVRDRVGLVEDRHDRRRLAQTVAVPKRDAAIEVRVQQRVRNEAASDHAGAYCREIGIRPSRRAAHRFQVIGIREDDRDALPFDGVEQRGAVGRRRHDDPPAGVQRRQHDDADAAHPRERRGAKRCVDGREVARLRHLLDVRNDVGVREHRATGCSGRARRVRQNREVVGLDHGRRVVGCGIVSISSPSISAMAVDGCVSGEERITSAGSASSRIDTTSVFGTLRMDRHPDRTDRVVANSEMSAAG